MAFILFSIFEITAGLWPSLCISQLAIRNRYTLGVMPPTHDDMLFLCAQFKYTDGACPFYLVGSHAFRHAILLIAFEISSAIPFQSPICPWSKRFVIMALIQNVSPTLVIRNFCYCVS